MKQIDKIFYSEAGAGNEIFLLLHNAGGDHQFFTHQIDFLKSKGHVYALDLPGHGRSDKSSRVFTIENYVNDVIEFCHQHEIKKMTAIGLNYGANVFIEIANQKPGLIKQLILIDPPLLMSPTIVKLVSEAIQSLLNTNEDYASKIVEKSFIYATPAAHGIALAAYKMIPPPILADVFKQLILWDQTSPEKIKNLSMPSLCILTDASLCTIEHLLQYNPKIKTAKVVDSLYWATLEVPEQINAMIDRFLTVK